MDEPCNVDTSIWNEAVMVIKNDDKELDDEEEDDEDDDDDEGDRYSRSER